MTNYNSYSALRGNESLYIVRCFFLLLPGLHRFCEGSILGSRRPAPGAQYQCPAIMLKFRGLQHHQLSTYPFPQSSALAFFHKSQKNFVAVFVSVKRVDGLVA
jgi:hypothetical protein